MSFGIYSEDIDFEDVQDAIGSAYSAGIVMFAAASNNGPINGVTYPANQSQVICIGATDGSGNKSKFTPGPYPTVKNFATLGEGVRSAWPKKLSEDGKSTTKVMSGTSCATPIAAGVTAMVIDYLKQQPNGIDENLETLLPKLRSKVVIEAILLVLCSKAATGFNVISPWIRFNQGNRIGLPHLLLIAIRDSMRDPS
jgi:subtilisin family serine protease